MVLIVGCVLFCMLGAFFESGAVSTASVITNELYYGNVNEAFNGVQFTSWSNATWELGRLPCKEDVIHVNDNNANLRIDQNTNIRAIRIPRGSTVRIAANTMVTLNKDKTDSCPNVEDVTAQMVNAARAHVSWKTSNGDVSVSLNNDMASIAQGDTEHSFSDLTLGTSYEVKITVTNDTRTASRMLQLTNGEEYPVFFSGVGKWNDTNHWNGGELPCSTTHARLGVPTGKPSITATLTSTERVRSFTFRKNSTLKIRFGAELRFRKIVLSSDTQVSNTLSAPDETCPSMMLELTTTAMHSTTSSTTTTTPKTTTTVTTSTKSSTTPSATTQTTSASGVTTNTQSTSMSGNTMNPTTSTMSTTTTTATVINGPDSSSSGGSGIGLIAGAAGGAVFLIIIIIVIIVVRKKKNGNSTSVPPSFSNFVDYSSSTSSSTKFSSYYGPIVAVQSEGSSSWRYTLNKNSRSALKDCFSKDIRAYELLANEPMYGLSILSSIQADTRKLILVLPATPQCLQPHLRSSRATATSPELMSEKQLLQIGGTIADACIWLLQRSIFCNCIRSETVMFDSSEQNWKLSLVGHNGRLLSQCSETTEHLRLWLAPELLSSTKSTERAIVWSFGVFLWELLSFGATPNNPDVNSPPSKAQHMSDALYGIVMSCCNSSPGSRPTLSAVRSMCRDTPSNSKEKQTDPRHYFPFRSFGQNELHYENPTFNENPAYYSSVHDSNTDMYATTTSKYEQPRGEDNDAFYDTAQKPSARNVWDSSTYDTTPTANANVWDSNTYDTTPKPQSNNDWDSDAYDIGGGLQFVKGRTTK
eukprot:m.14516 g.14516  ORF g.14516 m.14516 type:complete len:812 (-) comp4326_c0_seq1:362-2797(-)